METTNEMRILREFIQEFSPLHAEGVEDLTYHELTDIVKEVAEEL
jgi:hypothetical protein